MNCSHSTMLPCEAYKQDRPQPFPGNFLGGAATCCPHVTQPLHYPSAHEFVSLAQSTTYTSPHSLSHLLAEALELYHSLASCSYAQKGIYVAHLTSYLLVGNADDNVQCIFTYLIDTKLAVALQDTINTFDSRL